MSGASTKLLCNIRVLDLTRVLAGPFATMILGDMGAEVIKIENPKGGDDTRSWGPPFLNNESAYFLSINRNKKSVAVNMKHDKGIEVLKRLAAKSDIVVENFIPGKLDSFGLGYKDLQKLNSGLIYCSITGYGPDGPYSNRAGYDVIASSIGGLNHVTGPEDGDPCRVGVALTDISTGLFAHGSILAALYNREKTGFGQKIDCNLLSTQVALLSHIGSSYLNAGVEGKRWGTGHSSIVPYQAFKTKDGRYLTIGATNNHQFKSLCKVLNLQFLLHDERFKNNSDRVIHRKDLISILKENFLEKSCNDWILCFDGCSFSYGPINNIEGAYNDPQVIHNKMILEMNHPKAGGLIRVPGPPVYYSNQDYDQMLRPPVLGEHTRQVVSDLTDLTSNDIDDHIAEGVLFDGAVYT